MSLIEGFGDEVTIFLVVVLILLIVCLAWISTNIRDIPFFSVIIIELTHRRNRDTENTNQTEVQSSTEVTPSNSESQTSSEIDVQSNVDGPGVRTTETDPVTPSEISSENSPNGESSETPHEERTDEKSDTSQTQLPQESKTDSIDHSRDLSESELRQRRLNFFQGNKEGATISNAQILTDSSNSTRRSSSQEFSGSTSEPTSIPQEATPDSNPPVSVQSEAIQTQETDTVTGLITVRLKYLNDTQRNVTAAPNVTIGQFRRDNFATELSENKLVRFIFNGQDLRNDSSTLQNYNIGDNSVVHCLITQINQQAPQQRQEIDGSCDLGVIILPIFGVILCFVWYLRFEYRHFFTATSTFMLIGLTFLFIAAVLASWDSQRHREQVPHEHFE